MALDVAAAAAAAATVRTPSSNIPASFCTMATKPCAHELAGCLLTLSVHHRDAPTTVVCDTHTKEYILSLVPAPRLELHFVVELDEYTELNRNEMVKRGIWTRFQMFKARSVECALERASDTLFIDCDTIVLDKFDDIDATKQLGISPQFIQKKNVDETGYYNGGFLWTNQTSLPTQWRKYSQTSRYFDQAAIEDLAREYPYFEFGENYNLQAWRFILGVEPAGKLASYIRAEKGKIMYKDAPLKFIHTHFSDGRFSMFNKFMIQKLMEAKCYRELACIFRVINNAWVITIPKQPLPGIWHHTNDSYRELAKFASIRKEGGLTLKETSNRNCWLEPNIALYDRDTLEWINKDCLEASVLYLGNGSMEVEGEKLRNAGINVRPWIYWPRYPMRVELFVFKNPRHSYSARKLDTIFVGNFENSVQEKYRCKSGHDWAAVLSEYHCTAGRRHKFTPEEYLEKLHSSRFGLCLRGYGSKCHREVELMALGTIPLITPEVSISSYMEPPVEGLHFIRVNSPEELLAKTREISAEKWEEMSRACVEWYMRNVHSSNFWNNTISHILYDA